MKKILKLLVMLVAMSATMVGCDKPNDNDDNQLITDYSFDVSVNGDKVVGYEAGSFAIEVTSNIDWTATINGDKAFSIDNEGAAGNGIINISYSKNNSTTDTRTATLTIYTAADVPTNSYTINITQELNTETIEYTYTEFYKISGSNTASPALLSQYSSYELNGHTNEISDTSLTNADFTLTFGSGDLTHIRIGTNAGNYDYCSLGDYQAGVEDAFVTSGVTYQKAAGLFNRTSFSAIGKIRVVGEYDADTRLALVYSTDGTTWTLHPEGLHTPASTGYDQPADEYEFTLSSPITGYFGVLAVTSATSGAQRIQDAVITYYIAQ